MNGSTFVACLAGTYAAAKETSDNAIVRDIVMPSVHDTLKSRPGGCTGEDQGTDRANVSRRSGEGQPRYWAQLEPDTPNSNQSYRLRSGTCSPAIAFHVTLLMNCDFGKRIFSDLTMRKQWPQRALIPVPRSLSNKQNYSIVHELLQASQLIGI